MRTRWLELAAVLAIIALVARSTYEVRHGDSSGSFMAEILFEVMVVLMAAFVGLRMSDKR